MVTITLSKKSTSPKSPVLQFEQSCCGLTETHFEALEVLRVLAALIEVYCLEEMALVF